MGHGENERDEGRMEFLLWRNSVYFYPSWCERLLWRCRQARLSWRSACRAALRIRVGVTQVLQASLTYIWEPCARTRAHPESLQRLAVTENNKTAPGVWALGMTFFRNRKLCSIWAEWEWSGNEQIRGDLNVYCSVWVVVRMCLILITRKYLR